MSDMPAADGDGHVLENAKRIAELLDEPYRSFRVGSNASPDVMPIEPLTPLDGMPRSLGASRVGGRAYSAEDWLAALDRGPLEWSAVYPTLGLYAGYVRDPAYQATLCRAYNDWLAETFYPHCDGRILGVALLPTLDPAAAAAELRRAAGLGHAGVMFPADGTHLLGNACYDVVYEAAHEARLPVAVHASGSPFAPGAEIFPTFIQAHSVAHPYGIIRQFTSMMFEGVFERFPEVTSASWKRERPGSPGGWTAWTRSTKRAAQRRPRDSRARRARSSTRAATSSSAASRTSACSARCSTSSATTS